MPYSYITHPGDGVQTLYSLDFGYLNITHVKVYVDDVDTSFTWNNATNVDIIPAPVDGASIKIQRVTPKERIIDFQNASILDETTLDNDALQAFYIVQEAYDVMVNAITIQGGDSPNLIISANATQRANRYVGFDNLGEIYLPESTIPFVYHGASATAPTVGVDIGDLYYHSLQLVMYVYNGVGWEPVTASANYTVDSFTDTDGVKVSWNLTVVPEHINNTVVHVGGVHQHKTTNYTISGNQITFTEAPPTGVGIEVMTISVTDIGEPSDNTVKAYHIVAGEGILNSENVVDPDPYNFDTTVPLVFYQASAPSGWTEAETGNFQVNSGLRIVAGGTTGGGKGGMHDVHSPPSTIHSHTKGTLISATHNHTLSGGGAYGEGSARGHVYSSGGNLQTWEYQPDTNQYSTGLKDYTDSKNPAISGSVAEASNNTAFVPKYMDVILCKRST